MKTYSLRLVTALMLPFVFLISAAQTTVTRTNITPATALQAYLQNDDNTYKWEIHDSVKTRNVTLYNLLLTSQTWQDIVWVHQLSIFVPDENHYDGALLFITGGSVKDGEPRWKKTSDQLNIFFSGMAAKNKAIVAILSQTPNQPLYNGLTEDALISKTLHDFKNDGDYSRPLLFPMVKSAVKAMDAVQEFAKENRKHDISRFVISGASKRGWTTWLTGASDNRVTAIAPMVIDILNMPKSLNYQLESYGEYSEQIEDYVKLGILEDIRSESGEALVTMIDPYSYRKNLTMPKLLFMGTNDEYWVIDNVKNYLKDLPGITMIHYVPNAGHNLGGGATAFNALSAFFGITLDKNAYPVIKWEAKVRKRKVQVHVDASKDIPEGVKVWYADSDNRDFRKAEWKSRDLDVSGKSSFTVTEALPSKGYRAFYVDMKYKDANGGSYTLSTRAFMTDKKQIL